MKEKQFRCMICGEVFETLRNLKTVYNESDDTIGFICNDCLEEEIENGSMGRCHDCDHVYRTEDLITIYSSDENEEITLCQVCYKDYYKCYVCGNYTKDPSTDDTGNYVCPRCIDEYNYFYCDNCGCVVDENHVTIHDDIAYCNGCADRYLSICEHCGDYFVTEEEGYSVINRYGHYESWCENCFYEDALRCDHCGSYFNQELIHESKDGNEWLCEDCLEKDDRLEYDNPNNLDISPIKVYSYHWHKKPENHFKTIFHSNPGESTKRFFGIELETYNGDNRLIDVEKLLSFEKDFYYEHDGSLGFNDRECISHPRTMYSWDAFSRSGKMDEFLQCLKDAQFITDEKCGLHVHVSKESFEDWKVAALKITILMSIIWDDIIVPIAGRDDCYYSTHISKNDLLSSYGYGCCNFENDVLNKTSKHRCAINTSNEDTIELRFNRGTLKPEILIARIQFANYLIEYAQKFTISELLSVNESDENFEREFLNGITEPELKAYIESRVSLD